MSLALFAIYPDQLAGIISFFLFFTLLITWGRQVWITDDYDRAERAAAEAERFRQQAERERQARHAPAPTLGSWYRALGLTESASITEIKAAYRRVVKRYHPDRHQYSKEANAERFLEIQAAYAEIRKRRNFD